MTYIDRISVHEFFYFAENVAVEMKDTKRAGMLGEFKRGARAKLRGFVVVVQTNEGHRGEYCPFMGGTEPALGEVRKLAPRLLGQNPFEREAIFTLLKGASRAGSGEGIGPLDIANWDLVGKAYGRSISEMLGGYRKRLPTYVSTWRGDRNGGLDNPEAFIQFAKDCINRGIPGFKVHPWGDGNAKEDCTLALALAEAVGDGIELMWDPAGTYLTFHDALTVGRTLDEGKYRWYEDPLIDNGRSAHAHKRLREEIRTPLIMGERIRGLEQKADFIVAGATDILRAEPEFDLGITGLMKAANLAEAFCMDIEVANPSPAQRHCISAIRNTHFYEICNVGPECPVAMPPIYSCGYTDQLDAIGPDGCVAVPSGPGLGVVYDWEYIREHTLRTYEISTSDLSDLLIAPQ